MSSVPDDSPASTIATNSRLKTLGCRASAFERITPPSTSERTSRSTSARYLSSVCSSSVTSAATTLTPAAIIVANWRANTWSDFGFTLLNAPPTLRSAETPRSPSHRGRSPRNCNCWRAVPRSGAWTTPEISIPCALIASYANAAMSVPLVRRRLRQPVAESKVELSVKRTRPTAEPSRTVIVTSLSGRLGGVLVQVGGGPAANVPIAHDQDASTFSQYPFAAVAVWGVVGTEANEPWR